FIGSCRVATEDLVDWEDRLASDRIEARSMVHFIGEFFGHASLREGVLAQRLFIAILRDEIAARIESRGLKCLRDGDDLFVPVATDRAGHTRDRCDDSSNGRKLSVSIVTASPVSQLLHIGINIDPSGAPVAAIGLGELGIVPEEWIPAVL